MSCATYSGVLVGMLLYLNVYPIRKFAKISNTESMQIYLVALPNTWESRMVIET